MEDFEQILKKFQDKVVNNCEYKLQCIDLKNINYSDQKTVLKIKIEYEICYEKLYVGKWSEISNETKFLFTVLSFLLASSNLHQNDLNKNRLLKSLEILDKAIIYDVEGVSSATQYLKELAEIIHKTCVQNFPFNETNLKFCNHSKHSSNDITEISILDNPNPEYFITNFFNFHKPVKFTNSMKNWKALNQWNKVDYLMKVCGFRTVPIELGDKYDNEDWSQGTFKFHEFLQTILNKENTTKAYLAQHNLFDQIEELKNDFEIPKFCFLNDNSENPVIKSWIGPKNIISSMHTDDKHNIFCQIVGEKLVILAAPEDGDNLYTYEGLLNNTSKVDPENLNFEEFPNSRNVKFYKVLVKAGEILFIPKLWFHYVRSLSNSISVSFWFDE